MHVWHDICSRTIKILCNYSMFPKASILREFITISRNSKNLKHVCWTSEHSSNEQILLRRFYGRFVGALVKFRNSNLVARAGEHDTVLSTDKEHSLCNIVLGFQTRSSFMVERNTSYKLCTLKQVEETLWKKLCKTISPKLFVVQTYLWILFLAEQWRNRRAWCMGCNDALILVYTILVILVTDRNDTKNTWFNFHFNVQQRTLVDPQMYDASGIMEPVIRPNRSLLLPTRHKMDIVDS